METIALTAARLEYSDLETRVAWFNNSDVAATMMTDYPASLADTEQWFSANRLNDRRRDFCFWSHAAEEHRVAMGGLTDIDFRHQRAELYVVVNPGVRRRGYGTKAVIWLVNYAFSELALQRLYLYTLDDNTAALKLYERLGFRIEGVLRRHVVHRGAPHDRIVCALLKEEWQAVWWRQDAPLGLDIGG